MIHLYIGDGKGKTTAAIGSAIRAKGADKRVCFVQFLKGGYASSEIKPLKKAGVTVIRFSQKSPYFYKNVSIDKLKKNIQKDLERVKKLLKSKKYNVVILDEFLSVLRGKFARESDLLEVIQCNYKKYELILTGASSSTRILGTADYISRIKNIKHPYQSGVKARRGIEK